MSGMARCALRISAVLENPPTELATSSFEAPQLDFSPLEPQNFMTPKSLLGILVDGPRKPPTLLHFEASRNVIVSPIIKGDTKEVSIAAASIFAKVVRDKIMINLSNEEMFKDWNLNSHKGYPVAEHKKMLKMKTPLSIHRWSFTPVLEGLITEGRLPKRLLIDVAARKKVLETRSLLRERGLESGNAEECLKFVENEILSKHDLEMDKIKTEKKRLKLDKLNVKAKAKVGNSLNTSYSKRRKVIDNQTESEETILIGNNNI